MVGGAVVFVMGWSLEDRIEVNPSNAQVLQVIQFLKNALEITAVSSSQNVKPETSGICFFVGLEFVPVRSARMNLPGLRQIIRMGASQVLQRGIVPRIPISKPLGQNLVPDYFFCPIRDPVLVCAHQFACNHIFSSR